jgi:hypothetical protein
MKRRIVIAASCLALLAVQAGPAFAGGSFPSGQCKHRPSSCSGKSETSKGHCRTYPKGVRQTKCS